MRFILAIFIIYLNYCTCRIHRLEISNDFRRYIALSTFGFYKGGILNVKLINFKVDVKNEDGVFGFSLDRTLNDAMNPYLDTHQERCLLKEPFHTEHDSAVIYFTIDQKNKSLKINCSAEWKHMFIYKDVSQIPPARVKRNSLVKVSDRNLFITRRKRQSMKSSSSPGDNSIVCRGNHHLPVTSTNYGGFNYYNTSFAMYVADSNEEGLYNLYFHSCPSYEGQEVSLDFVMEIEESNRGSYLSAGEMPLPALYFTMAILFFLSGAFWVFLLRASRHPVFKLHWLMSALVFLKSLSLAFHGINYHYIEMCGEHVAAWAVLYYVAHLLKGALLFVTLVLVGTGWTFIKHVLADRDKRLFMIIIPLQVLANVAEIIMTESEEGAREHRAWRDVFILVDLLCCGAILFPVVWSIRHLQEASHTDGKAAVNLRKLKLFRHFYVMIVCYIYFTRIIVYLLKITVPFQYGWLDEMFREMATYVFFVLTGYKFRPASANPYFTLSTDDEEECLTESGLTEGLSKVTSRNQPIKYIPEEEIINEDEKDNLLTNATESSHDYD